MSVDGHFVKMNMAQVETILQVTDEIDFGPRSNDSEFGSLGSSDFASGDVFEGIVGSRVGAQTLPFTVGVLTDAAVLEKVQALRAKAYGRHLQGQAASFGLPDPIDRRQDVVIFVARDKATAELVGSARIQSNVYGPLQIERSVELAPHHANRHLVEVTRLVVAAGYAPPVKLALVKAIHLFCITNQICGVVAGARRALVRQYEWLGFSDMFGDDRLVPLGHAGNLAHRILFRDAVTSESDSRARRHPSYDFVFKDYHPDISVAPVRTATPQAGAFGERHAQSSKVA